MPNARQFQTAEEAAERDPRQFPYGYLIGGSLVLNSDRVFLWFRTIDELVDALLETEPRLHGLTAGRGLEAYQARMRPILDQARRDGLTESSRTALLRDADGRFIVDWWGTYYDLRDGRGMLGRRLLSEFLGEEYRGQRLPAADERYFIEFLKTCRV